MSFGNDSFVWDGGGALSSKAKAQKLRDRSEKIAQMLMEQQGGATDTSPVGHWTQGAARVADALFGAIQRGRDEKAASGYSAQADQIDAAGRAQSAKTFSPLQEFFGGGAASKPPSYSPNQIEQNPLASTAPTADKQGGSRSWRNNNPGNIEYGNFAQSSGATGTDGRFAVFPSYEAGRSAQEKLLFDSKNYRDLPLSQAIARWAPSSENNVPAYLAAIGGNPSMRMQDFTPSQRAEILNNMQKHEGWRAGKSAPLNQVASNDPNFMPASAPPQDSAINAMPPQLRQPAQAPQMAQNAQVQEPSPQAPQPSNTPTAAQLMAVMGDEYASDAQKFAAKQMLDHVMQLDPRLQDPLERQNKQLQIEQAQGNLKKQPLELYQLEQNISLARTKEEREAALFKYDQALKQGQIDKQPIELDQAKANLANTGKTGAIQEFEYSQNNPGFIDEQLKLKKAGSTNINNNMGGEKFDEEFAKSDAKVLADVSSSGLTAQRNIGRIGRLEKLLQNSPNGIEGTTKQLIGEWGVNTDGLDKIQATQAMINSLVPEQRPPGSGPMSDKDIELFKGSIPRILNQPNGNALITQTLRGLAQYDAEGATIVQRMRRGEIKRSEAFDLLQNRVNPLADFSNMGGVDQPIQDGGNDPELENALKQYGG